MYKYLLIKLTLSFIVIGFISAKPNIVVFLVDDLGIADVGCFGNDTIRTPNIDRLAEGGALLLHDVHPDSVCTPNRAALMTGRYPIRSGLASDSGQYRMFLRTSSSGGLPQNETTIAEIVSVAGYKTGFIGKWHLGLHLSTKDFHFHPLKQGFHYFYGLSMTNIRSCEPGQYLIQLVYPSLSVTNVVSAILVTSLTLYVGYLTGLLHKPAFIVLLTITLLIGTSISCYFLVTGPFNCFVLKNYDVVEQPTSLENLTMRFTDEAVNFIRENRDGPFLLYMSFAKVHTALFNTRPFVNHSVHGRYGDNVEEMDWSVGQIMSAVDKLRLKENTFVYFTSDNGPHLEEINSGEYHGGWKGIYRGGKGQSWEGGLRMPTIVSWPKHIPAGISLDKLTSTLDLLPTVAKLVGGDVPKDRVIDGKDLLPLLTNQTQHTSHEFIFHYCGNQIHAVRYHAKESDIVWKVHLMTPNWSEGTDYCIDIGLCLCHGHHVTVHKNPLLFDITNNPGENSPISDDRPEYKEVMKHIDPGMCLGVLRAEFRLVQFRLQYTNAADFAESPWLGVPIVLVYRTVIAAFCTAVLIASGLFYSGNKEKWFIFLTNWSFFFVTLYFICSTIVTGVHFKNRYQQQQNVITDGNENDRSLQMGVTSEDKEPRSCVDVESEDIVIAHPSEASRIIQMRWFHQALWVIYNIASTAALLVTISFYTFFRGAGAMSVFTHGVNSILVVIDTMLSSIPVRLFHVVYPALYFTVYLIFTLIYWAAGQPYIYPMTDYTGQPVFSAITVVCLFFIALPLCQTLMFGFYCLRVWMKTKCC